MREQPYSRGIALELTWRGAVWTGRAVVSLDHDASDPEATIARIERAEHGDALTELVNLGRSSRAWTVDGRALTLAPGRSARVFESASQDGP